MAQRANGDGIADVAIIGGGVIGSAIAFNLLAIDPGVAVVVVERDPTYRTASSALSLSSIRQQFSAPVNIAMSRYGLAFLKEIERHLAVDGTSPEVGLVERGYLYLASEAGKAALEANHAIQREHGVNVALLDRHGLKSRFPWLDTSDLAAGSFGLSGEGWFDGWTLLQAFRRKARSLGARFVTGEVIGLNVAGSQVEALQLADGTRIGCANAVNAAGPWARAVAAMAGIDLPVHAEKHCVFVFDCKEPLRDCPLVIDASGIYFRPEGQFFLCGGAPEEKAGGAIQPLEVDYTLFDDVIWPRLAERVPAFAAIKLQNAWAGYYEMNVFDQNAILGAALELPNLYFANGFSGHGMQQSPAAGRGIAELILHGAYRTLDLSPLGFERLKRNEPLYERNII
jgi:FAD-dependent oxidoreductase domain-containing protein 1